MKLRVLAIAMTIAGVIVLGTTASAAPGGRPFRIELSGANEVPTNAHGAADRGSIVLTLNQGLGMVCYTLGELTLTAGEPLPTGGHIHEAPAGDAGPVVLTLFGGPANMAPTTNLPPPSDYPTDTRCIEGVDRDLIKEIRQNPENYYVNLHNMTHPAGVVRGQLR